MITIDLNRVREALPSRATVTLKKTEKGTPYLRIIVANPSLYNRGTKQEENDIEMIESWLSDIIGKENIMEIDKDSTGTPWNYYLNRKPYNFIGLTDSDINSFSGMNLVFDGKLQNAKRPQQVNR